MKTGELIRQYRKRKKITLKELAQKVGITEQAISQYERSVRTPNAVTLQKICDALNLPLESLNVDIPVVPTTEMLNKNPDLALDTQIKAYLDDVDRLKVKIACTIFKQFNYEIEIDKNFVLISDNITQSLCARVPKEDFITMSEIFFGASESFVNCMKTKYEIKREAL